MNADNTTPGEERHAKATVLRLANSCERAAARGDVVTPIAHDLNEDDYRTIAEILRGFAATVR